MRSTIEGPTTAILVSSDAALSSQVRAALEGLGWSLIELTKTEEFLERLEEGRARLGIVDMRVDDAALALEAVRARSELACLIMVSSSALLPCDCRRDTVMPIPCELAQIRLLAEVACRNRPSAPLECDLAGQWVLSAFDPVLIVDEEARIVIWNQGAIRVLGYAADQVIGQPLSMLLPTRYSARRRAQTQKTLLFSAQTPRDIGETVMQDAEGREFPVEYSVAQLEHCGHRYTGFHLRDLTERIKSEDELMRLASFPEFAPAPNIELDSHGTILYLNPAAEILLEETPDSCVLDGLPELLQNHDLSGGAYFIREVNDHEVFYEQHIHYIASWDSLRVYMLDISERKRAEQALRKSLDSLELRVIERTIELEREVEERKYAESSAYEASRAKSVFLASMSHELRTPLNVIIGFSELLIDETDNETTIADLNKVLSSAHHLLGLINELLDLSKIEAGKMTISTSKVVMSDFLDSLAVSGRALAATKGNRFVLDYPADVGVIVTDELRLRQVLLNLLSNAAKFTDEGVVGLSVDLVDEPPGIKMRVHDTGIGLSSKQLDRIWKPFTQADESIARRFGGTGLGLTICKEMCDLLGATIFAESTLGQGTTFTVMLTTGGDKGE